MKTSIAMFAAALALGIGILGTAPVSAQNAPMAPKGDEKSMTTAPAKAPEKEMAKPEAPKSIEVTGEVLDMACYAAEGEHGEAHKACAADCLAKGSPVGILAADGKVYLVANHGDDEILKQLRGMAAETVKLQADVVSRGGLLTLNAKKIESTTAKPAMDMGKMPMKDMMDKGMDKMDKGMNDMQKGADKMMDKGMDKMPPAATK
jgi:hypothetical protein